MEYSRHTETREAVSTTHDIETSPFPTNGYIPDREGDVANDVGYGSEDNWGPAGTVQQRV